MKIDRKSQRRAFTRLELLAVTACVLLLGLFGLSVSANTRDRSERVVCMNNLRQIGRAYNLWASDHGDENPFTVNISEDGLRGATPLPPTLNVPGIGTYPTALRNNPWFQFLWIYRELQSPAVLVCPSDVARNRATEFSNDPAKGFAHVNFQNRATSYFIWLHALKETPNSPLSGDRHIQYNNVNTSCYTGIGTALAISKSGPTTPTSWTYPIHGPAGNLLRNDGSVAEVTTPGLRALIDELPDADNGTHHFLAPQ